MRWVLRNWIPILGVLVAASVLLAIAYRVQEGRRQARAVAAGEAADIAFEASRFVDAIPAFTTYLQSEPFDVERALRLAISHQFVAETGDQHLVRSIELLRALQLHAPDRLEVIRELGRLYARVGLHAEAIALADRMATRSGGWGPETIHLKSRGLAALHRFRDLKTWLDQLEDSTSGDETLQVAILEARIIAAFGEQHWAAVDEKATEYLETENSWDAMVLMAAAEAGARGAAENGRFSVALATRHAEYPDDATLTLIAASVARLAGDPELAGAHLSHGLNLEHGRDDEESLMLYFAEAQRQYQSGEAIRAIRDVVVFAPRPVYREALAANLSFSSQFEKVLVDLPDDAAARVAGDTASGYRALALFEEGKDREAEAALAELVQKATSPEALAWSVVLGAVYRDAPSPIEVVEASATALQADPQNPFVHFWRGQAFRKLGEKEIAVTALARATDLAPLWPAPALALAEVTLELNDPVRAWAAAQEAFRRRASNEALAAVAMACAELPDAERSRDIDRQVLDLLAALADDTLRQPAVAIALPRILARVGESDRAREELALASAGAAQWPMPWRRRLIETVSASPTLSKLVPEGPEWSALVSGIEESDRAAADNAASRWLEALSDQVSRGAMLPEELLTQLRNRLVEEPVDRSFVRAALANRWVAADEASVASLTEHLQDLVGRESVQWRVAEARRLIRFGRAGTDLGVAIDHLRGVVAVAPRLAEPQLLLSRAFLSQNNRPAAVAALERVKAMPDVSLDVNLELANLYAALGDLDRARWEVERAEAKLDAGSPAQVGQTAGLLARLGSIERAIRILEADAEPTESNGILLANFYRRQGRYREAESLYRRLLENPSSTVVQLTADFFASDGRLEEAHTTLDLLGSLDLLPGLEAQIRAGVIMRHESVEKGYAVLRDAAESADIQPDAGLWRRLIGLTVRLRPPEDVLELIGRAVDRFPASPEIVDLAKNAEIWEATLPEPALWPLLVSIFENPDRQREGTLVLREYVDLLKQNVPPERVADAMRRSADLYPRFLPLQSVTVQLLQRLNRFEDATAVAIRAMASFPEAVEPAWMAAEAMAAAGRWSEALVLAREWRQRSSIESIAADLMIAEARFAGGDTAGGIEELTPHLQRALQDPERFASVLLGASRILVDAGEPERAEEILAPLLRTGQRWRFAWTSIAVLLLDDRDTCERWLLRVASEIDRENLPEQLMLVQGMRTAAERFEADAALSRMARDRLDDLLVQPNPPGDAYLLLAMMEEGDGDAASAMRGYRRTLELDRDNIVALNNLAMLLLGNAGAPEEAITLARRATELQPHAASVWDTLGAAQRAAGRLGAAAEAMQTAVRLEPTRAVWQERLAEVLIELDRVDEAKRGSESP